MAKYLVNISYTTEGAKGLRKDGGTKRVQVASKAIEGLGGKLESFYFTLGHYDAVVIADFPDVVSATALSVAIAAAGGVRLTTTPLLTATDMDRACGKKTAYKAPGA
jgi:uncharacterized protein with GYD domain